MRNRTTQRRRLRPLFLLLLFTTSATALPALAEENPDDRVFAWVRLYTHGMT